MERTMRVGFAGTPAFAATALQAILNAGFPVPVVLTQPDRPKGRGLRVEPSPVKALALSHGLAVLQPRTLKTRDDREAVVAVPLDVLVVAAYGLILPQAILDWPRHGGINIHGSLLPRWRGAAPIQRALLAGDAETGVTIMRMDAGLDTGPMLDVVRVPIAARDTGGTLTDKLAATGATAIVSVLRRLARGETLVATPQPAAGATYAAKVERADAVIDWCAAAVAIDRVVRAFDPVPGAATALAGEPGKIWRGEVAPASDAGTGPGTVVAATAQGIVVACGEGAFRITELQQAGGKRMNAAAFVAGRRIAAGDRFDPAAPSPAPARG
jgi:methionyl-tRNA formyltransferase